MSNDGSVAPKERVNITYKPATGDVQSEVELPFKILMVGDYTGKPDARPVEERRPINVDKDNFNQVMAEQKLQAAVSVPNKLTPEAGGELSMLLNFRGLGDFTPDGVAAQVPELQRLLELRGALTALKGPLGNLPAFRKSIQGLLDSEEGRAQLLKELSVGDE